MNKYRIVDEYDYYNLCSCLNCKKDFISEESYIYCPKCGIKFDGVFDKKNPRYKEPTKNYNEEYTFQNGYCYYSKTSRLVLYEILSTGKYNLIVHCALNSTLKDKSCSVYMIEKYNYYITYKPSSKYKLIIVNKANKKVIKEN